MLFWLNKIFRWIRMTFQAVQNVRNRWVPELKKLSDNVEKLEASLTGTDECVDEKHGHRIIEETLELDTDTPPTDKVPFRCHGC